MMHASVANEIVIGINCVTNITVSPQDFGIFRQGGSNTVLDLSAIKDYIDGKIPTPPGSGDYVLTSSGGTLAWKLLVDC